MQHIRVYTSMSGTAEPVSAERWCNDGLAPLAEHLIPMWLSNVAAYVDGQSAVNQLSDDIRDLLCFEEFGVCWPQGQALDMTLMFCRYDKQLRVLLLEVSDLRSETVQVMNELFATEGQGDQYDYYVAHDFTTSITHIYRIEKSGVTTEVRRKRHIEAILAQFAA